MEPTCCLRAVEHGLLTGENRTGTMATGNVLRRAIMLHGKLVVLRPVRERDLAAFIDAHTEISNRGEFFPLGIQPESVLRRNYAETGFWERDEGTLLIWNRNDVMVGHIEFFRPVNYWDAYELSYQLYGAEHTGHGYTTEAVRLLVDYLFGAKKVNRISLVIVPENVPSRRIAEKVWIPARRHGARSILQRRPQRRRSHLLAAPRRPSTLAPIDSELRAESGAATRSSGLASPPGKRGRSDTAPGIGSVGMTSAVLAAPSPPATCRRCSSTADRAPYDRADFSKKPSGHVNQRAYCGV